MKILKFFLPMPLKRLYYSRKRHDFNQLSSGEIEFFELISPLVKNIVDVGPRTDTYYSEFVSRTALPGINIFLIEANPIFAKTLKEKLEKIDGNNFVLNVGVGLEPSKMFYFFDTQSFVLESHVGNSSKVKSKERIEICTLDSFVDLIEFCDFYKSDIEEMDFYALLGGQILLKNVHFIQFELGLGMPFSGRKVENQDYWDLLEPNFYLYLLKDENPVWKTLPNLPLLLELDDSLKQIISILQGAGYGFNIVGVNKDKGVPLHLEKRISSL